MPSLQRTCSRDLRTCHFNLHMCPEAGLGALRGKEEGDEETKGGKRVARPWWSDSSERANPSHLTRRICRFRRNSFPLHPHCPCSTSSPSVRFNTAPSTYGFSLCLRRGPCAGRASQAREDAELRCCAFETLFLGDVQRHAHGRGAAQPAALDGGRVRTGSVQRAGPGALQTQQVSRAGGRERLAQRLGRWRVITHDAGEIWCRIETGRTTRKCWLFTVLQWKPLNLDFFFKRDNWVPIKDYVLLN